LRGDAKPVQGGGSRQDEAPPGQYLITRRRSSVCGHSLALPCAGPTAQRSSSARRNSINVNGLARRGSTAQGVAATRSLPVTPRGHEAPAPEARAVEVRSPELLLPNSPELLPIGERRRSSADIDRELQELIYGDNSFMKKVNSSSAGLPQVMDRVPSQRSEASALAELGIKSNPNTKKTLVEKDDESPADAILKRLSQWRGGAIVHEGGEKESQERQQDPRRSMVDNFNNNLNRVRTKLSAVQRQFVQNSQVSTALREHQEAMFAP